MCFARRCGIKCFLLHSFLSCLSPACRRSKSPCSCLLNLHLLVPRAVTQSPGALLLFFARLHGLVRVCCVPSSSAPSLILAAHFGAVLRILDLYPTCLTYVDCLPGSALKAVVCCFFQIPLLRCSSFLMLPGDVIKLTAVEWEPQWRLG